MLTATQVNKNSRVVEKALSSPLGTWFRRMRSESAFLDATAAGPMIDTLNGIFGAVCIANGLEQCSQFFKVVIPANEEIIASEITPARSKLQQELQAILKDRYKDVFKLEARFLSKPSEAHAPQIEVVLLLGTQEVGRAVAGRKKEAAEMASRNALDNPDLKNIVRTFEDQTFPRDPA